MKNDHIILNGYVCCSRRPAWGFIGHLTTIQFQLTTHLRTFFRTKINVRHNEQCTMYICLFYVIQLTLIHERYKYFKE